MTAPAVLARSEKIDKLIEERLQAQKERVCPKVNKIRNRLNALNLPVIFTG